MNLFIRYSAIALLFAGSVWAQPAGGPPPREDKCRTERETYCKDMKHGPELHRCLEDNSSKLSATCKAHLAEMKDRHEKFKAACADDESKYCKNVDRGPAHMKCLRENESKLSAACKAALPPPPPDRR
ncbi:hypothetical protein EHQ53_03965 [Leptospira langatensis]|uniref:Cys-rich protein n=1 Tax=Leptospira langatensis TaxID=2484983 RepID=A0A5F1ZW35_9LEPT|nr:hypothetical protein [Leptospira langatensis]TGJ99983.1 hypothetical protein EHO57_11830 [Leptospira langatensis]TGL42621.1 hypothetical protein EHQ53_03965 [Leptospira langatensis]